MSTTLALANIKINQMLIYRAQNLNSNTRMDMHLHRRMRLKALVEDDYKNDRRLFCDASGISESRLAQLLSSSYRDGKGFGEKAARSLEAALGLGNLYFDAGAIQSKKLGVTDRESSSDKKTYVQRLNEQEGDLLTLFRSLDDRGRQDILDAAALILEKASHFIFSNKS